MRFHAGLMGLNQHTAFNVFHYAAWAGLGGRSALGAWVVRADQALLRPGITHAVLIVNETAKPIDADRLNATVKQELPDDFHRIHLYSFAVLPRNELGKVLRQEVRAKAISIQSKWARANEPQL